MSGNTLIGGNRPTRASMEKLTWNLVRKTSQVEPSHGGVKPIMMMMMICVGVTKTPDRNVGLGRASDSKNGPVICGSRMPEEIYTGVSTCLVPNTPIEFGSEMSEVK